MKLRDRSIAALLLLAPVPTIGIASVLIIWPGPTGRVVFGAAKIWLLLFPAFWHLLIERKRMSWSPPRKGGLGMGLLLGMVSALIIFGTYRWITLSGLDSTAMRAEVADMGLSSSRAFILGALYWIFVNSVIEEYVFRWFIQSRCELLWSRPVAIGISAAIFTTHHVVAMATFFKPGLVVLASVGVFIGGATWSWMITRYRSIWPGWVAHACADIAIFASGYYLLFG